MATPADANPGEFCREEYGSGAIRVCSFATMEQCQAAVSGRNGVCVRDPFLPNNSSAFAYQPKHPLAKSVRHPLVKSLGLYFPRNDFGSVAWHCKSRQEADQSHRLKKREANHGK